MELQITGKNIELSPAVRHYIERKLGKLSRHLPNITESKVEISEEKTKSPQQHFVAQVTVDSNGTLLRSEVRGADLFTAIDKVVEVINRQIERYKGKRYEKGRGSSLARGGFSEAAAEKQPLRKVVKVKRFSVKPMSVAEAIDQMELLGHDFFLFFNADSEGLNLLYRRKDGNYGLIEPELG
ncbi:MAG: ribosome-associated translation inhibitor RaiA [Dehalococcoidia bacterium]|nr:MAG: ribosome-associated translation inhibitor RaiA [Dehalococcoidia bacterium]